jgi:hypothetical protein
LRGFCEKVRVVFPATVATVAVDLLARAVELLPPSLLAIRTRRG